MRMATVGMAQADSAVLDMLQKVADSATVRTVYGEPVVQQGVTVIPAARVIGGGGGGGGHGPHEQGGEGRGSGGGLRLSARPVGAFVIRRNRVRWRPAIDVNRVILGGQIVAILAMLARRSMMRRSMMGRSMMGRSMMGRSMMGRSMMGRSMMGRSMKGRSTMGRMMHKRQH
jgi:uncharacterized spore protein YtfJ